MIVNPYFVWVFVCSFCVFYNSDTQDVSISAMAIQN